MLPPTDGCRVLAEVAWHYHAGEADDEDPLGRLTGRPPSDRSKDRGIDVRTVVIGASSGLGRCIGIGLAQRGGQVALLARRRERLDAAAEEAGPSAIAIECDVTDPDSCTRAIAKAADGLGGIDGLVYTPGIGPLMRLVDTDADTWRRVFETNVTGAALVTAAAVPHLAESSGTAVYLSSVSASQTPPWPGLGAYAVSKAALDKLVEAWRNEHPAIGFTRLIVGECGGGDGDAQTEFAAGWDRRLAAEVVPTWLARNYMSGMLMDVTQLVDMVERITGCDPSVSMPSVSVAPRLVHPV
jgi:NAD(P)-dependent dehydrogenase (short-subunit alcohol dehydrogenase family)